MVNKPVSAQWESVWDYPRPPRVEKAQQNIRVIANGVTIGKSQDAFRVLVLQRVIQRAQLARLIEKTIRGKGDLKKLLNK
jgi:hypothetical protein